MTFHFNDRRETDLEAGRPSRSFLAENAIEGSNSIGQYSVPLVAHDSQADFSFSAGNTTADSMSQSTSENTVTS